MPTKDYPLTLFYDGACPVCRTEMAHLRARDAAGRLRFEDVRGAGFTPPDGLARQALLDAIHGRTGDGRVVVGVETLRLAYAAVGLGWMLAFTAWAPLRRPTEWAYRVFARHRFMVPAWFGLAAFGLRRRDALCSDDACGMREPRP